MAKWHNVCMSYFEIAKHKFDVLKNKKDVIVLGIESSCDETSVAVVKNGKEILSNVIATQIDIHKRFGGVVPEVASRNHIMAIENVYKEALKEAGIEAKDIDAVAVTYGAGLIGALLVGVNFAKALAISLEVPLIAVSHIEGHISSNYISYKNLEPPFVCLLVSGGHTALLKVDKFISHSLLGTTIDDAVGEAFDKVARILGLAYPGGPNVDKLAKLGENNIEFIKHNTLKNTLNFSFSGIKTAVINYVHNLEQKGEKISVPDVCASFQTYVVNELTEKCISACMQSELKKLVVAGGVSANSFLKDHLTKACQKENIELFMPDLKLCTDNAGMIASAGYFYIQQGLGLADLTLTGKATVGL